MCGEKCSKCPSLPEDIWRQIAAHLPVRTLSNLQEVSKMHHKAIVSEEMFRERFLSLHNHIGPPQNLSADVSWAKLYRYSRALRYPPRAEFLPGFEYTRIIAAVGENVVLYDASNKNIRGYPGNWERNVDELCTTDVDLSEMCLEMPNCQLAFIESRCAQQGGDGTVALRLIDVRSGKTVHTIRIPVFESELSSMFTQDALHMPKVFLLAGKGKHIIYFTANGNMLVVDLMDGNLVCLRRDIPAAFGRLVRTECVETGGFLISGVVVDGEREGRYAIWEVVRDEKLFDIGVGRSEALVDVVRSSDGKTYGSRILQDGRRVLIEVQQVNGDDQIERNRVVFCTDVFTSSARASGEFSLTGCEDDVQLRMVPAGANGRAALEGLVSDGRVVRIRTGTPITVEKLREQRVPNTPFDWGWMAGDGMLIVAGRMSGFLSVFDVGNGRCMGSYPCARKIKDIVIAGHWLVATVDGGVNVWHFGKFCRHSECSMSNALRR